MVVFYYAENDRPMVPPSCCVKDQYGKYINLQKCQTWQLGPPKLASGPTLNEALFYNVSILITHLPFRLFYKCFNHPWFYVLFLPLYTFTFCSTCNCCNVSTCASLNEYMIISSLFHQPGYEY